MLRAHPCLREPVSGCTKKSRIVPCPRIGGARPNGPRSFIRYTAWPSRPNTVDLSSKRTVPPTLVGPLLCAVLACGQPAPPEPASAPAPAKTDLGSTTSTPPPARADTAEPSVSPDGVRRFDEELAALDHQIAGRRQIATKNGRSWTAYGVVASLHLQRARLSGSYDDYAAAEEALRAAFDLPQAMGPYLVRARLNFSLHRLDRIDADLDKAAARPGLGRTDETAGALLRANLAFQRGQYDDAKRRLEAELARDRSLPALSSMAYYHWKATEFEQAEALYKEALAAYRGSAAEPAAWIHLQLGLMDLDRGRLDEALQHYRQAEARLQGYWLVEEHIAEILVRQGHFAKAEAMYLDIVERTDNPEFMDALAELYASEPAKAAEWVARARTRYDQQLEQFPEAAYGHALEHWLAHEPDHAKVVRMAEKNHALRPNVDAQRLLAEAQLRAGHNDDALKTVQAMLATPMRSADIHLTASQVFAAVGQEADAAKHTAAAIALDPTAQPEPPANAP